MGVYCGGSEGMVGREVNLFGCGIDSEVIKLG